jgi:hypothetical protein
LQGTFERGLYFPSYPPSVCHFEVALAAANVWERAG